MGVFNRSLVLILFVGFSLYCVPLQGSQSKTKMKECVQAGMQIVMLWGSAKGIKFMDTHCKSIAAEIRSQKKQANRFSVDSNEEK